MGEVKIDITNSDDKTIAKKLRSTADMYDPWHRVWSFIRLFLIGAIFITVLDYGDVWICVGECGHSQKGPTP